MTATIHRLPFSPRPVIHVAPEDERELRAQVIDELASALRRAVSVCGQKYVFDQLTAAMRIADTNGWRDRARSLLNGEKK